MPLMDQILFSMPNRPKKKNRPWRPPVNKTPFGRRLNNNYDFYNSTKWRKKSKSYRDKHPFCAECERNGIVGAAEVVDHKRGLQFLLDNGIDPFDDNELEGMCHHHHNVKSGKQAHGKVN